MTMLAGSPQQRQAVAAHAEAAVDVDIHHVVVELVVGLVCGAHEVEHARDVKQAVERAVLLLNDIDGPLTHGRVAHVAAHEVDGTRAIGELLVLDKLLPRLLVEVEHHELGPLTIERAHGCRAHATGAAHNEDDLAFIG